MKNERKLYWYAVELQLAHLYGCTQAPIKIFLKIANIVPSKHGGHCIYQLQWKGFPHTVYLNESYNNHIWLFP
jgi:hypothetical protein